LRKLAAVRKKDYVLPTPTGSSLIVTDFAVPSILNLESIIDGVKWGGALGTGVEISYSFPGSSSVNSYWSSTYGDKEPNDLTPFSATEQALVRKIFKELKAYTNLTFKEVADTVSSVGDIRFARTVSADKKEVAHAYFPSESPEGGDVWFIDSHPWNKWIAGQTYHYAESYYHEIGHALGLKHSFGSPKPIAASFDNTNNTVMSYTDVPQARGSTIPQNTGYFCVLDVKALQLLYGANTSFHAGNDNYGASYLPMAHTMWDAGGYDTVRNCLSIDLGSSTRYGNFSILGKTGAALKYEVVSKDIIEAAYGARAGWHATGNSGDNLLVGANLANSTVAHGASVISGGGGDDILVLEKTASAAAKNAANVMRGGTGNDQITGYTHNDNLFGESGSDSLIGDAGKDLLSGGAGNDTLNGGSGADLYRFELAGNGVDTIVTFSAIDTLQFRAAGFGFGSFAGFIDASEFISGEGHDALDGNDYFMFDTQTRSLWFDTDGNDTGVAVEVATFSGSYVPRASDIEII
jgi:Ca2+-binding RTX toxin-like protein